MRDEPAMEQAARGWAERLARVVDQHDLVPMRGWLALCRAAHADVTADPAGAQARAGQALEAAQLTGDTDLELCALSELGYALVQVGRVAEGTALDEAMAGALGGEAREVSTVVFAGCRSITSCSRVLEFERAAQWIRAADKFCRRYGNLHLYTTCRTEYGTLPQCQGRWDEAERELRTALRIEKNAEPAPYGEARAALAALGARAAQRWPVQPRHRRTAVPHLQDRRAPRAQPACQALRGQPRRGSRLRGAPPGGRAVA